VDQARDDFLAHAGFTRNEDFRVRAGRAFHVRLDGAKDFTSPDELSLNMVVLSETGGVQHEGSKGADLGN
jgi:hypothetical protein